MGPRHDRRSDDIRQLSIGTALAHTITFGSGLRRSTAQADTLNADLLAFLKA